MYRKSLSISAEDSVGQWEFWWKKSAYPTLDQNEETRAKIQFRTWSKHFEDRRKAEIIKPALQNLQKKHFFDTQTPENGVEKKKLIQICSILQSTQ